jgi:predicted Ser/Thr protein kinase
MSDYRRAADEALAGAYEEPMDLEAFVDRCFERPLAAANSATYLLRAIESYGTRSVVEDGETLQRYRFFDDPANDGEHAVLGNTRTLNDFVDDLRTVSEGRGKGEKIFWFDGPTATGKSELKRCLVNGLREFSKTAEGRRYTIEWNIENTSGSLGYGEYDDESNWYRSPVRSNPLSVFPHEVQRRLAEDLSAESDLPVRPPGELDPFSREAYHHLAERYRREGSRELFSAITDRRHFRVKNYVVGEGTGIGILHTEDDGTPKQRLVGSWMPGMLRELNSRGRKNPQAFSYDGVLSQGNGLLTVVEDASHHADLLQKLLNVPDEGRVKLDKGIGMDVDTQLLVISNPDLDAELDQFADRNDRDPLKALKRRLDRHEFRYLTSTSLEAQLIRRELADERAVWVGPTDQLERKVREAVVLPVREAPGKTSEREFAPHTVAAAALYSVVTRLDPESLPQGLTLVDAAELFDTGYIQEGDVRRTLEDFDLGGQSDRATGRVGHRGEGGTHGIPVTYTRDVLADLLRTKPSRRHSTLPVENVVTPDDVLDAMVDNLPSTPVFSRAEVAEFEDRVAAVREAIRARQETDVLDAMLADKRVDEATVAEYVEHVFAWNAGEQVATDRGPVDPDPLKMKVFETQHLGRFGPGDYERGEASDEVAAFRREKVITALNRFAWDHRDEGFTVSDVDLMKVPVIRTVLETHSWDDVRRLFPDFDPSQWADPPANTETARVKVKTIEEMQRRGYSPASAELASRTVMGEVSNRWD